MDHCSNGHDLSDQEARDLSHQQWQQALVEYVNESAESLIILQEDHPPEDCDDQYCAEKTINEALICDLADYVYNNYSIPFLPPNAEGGLQSVIGPIADALEIDLEVIKTWTFFQVMEAILHKQLEIRTADLHWNLHMVKEGAIDLMIKHPDDVSPFVRLDQLPEWNK